MTDRLHPATLIRTAPLVAAGLLPAVSPPAPAQCLEGCTVIHTLVGESPGDQFGWVSNDVGDVDGDGVHDFVITASTSSAGGFNAGRIYVYSGLTGEELWRDTGQAANWRLGHDAAPAGDIDGDGTPDVIAGAPFNGAGRAIVYDGLDGTVIHTFDGETSGDNFGYRVWGGGDFDGDGRADVVIGAQRHDGAAFDAGRVYVYSGADLSLICAVDGPTSSDRLGAGVAFVGDVSQPPDGRDDIVAGAPDAAAGGGLAFVYSWDGSACQVEHQLTPPPPSMNFGLWFMNGGGDVDLDGTPDVYVNDFQVNRAHVFSGADGSIIHSLDGNAEGGGFGIGRMVDDVNGDGHADLVLAAWISDQGANNAGKAFVYSGKTGGVLETFTHDVAGAGFGFDANGMGDVNGDGRFDYLITAASDLGSTGVCYVIAGTVAPVDFNGDGTVNVQDLVILVLGFGDCVDDPCLGDVNGDGTVDVTDLVAVILNWG